MSNKNKTPFKKSTPPSQYMKPEFYWRGGDALREQEYITDEYKKALAEKRRAEQELRQVEDEVAEASATLGERSGYTTALANFLEGDTESFTEENKLKSELNEVNLKIEECEAKLAKAQDVHNPAVSSSLQKEKAYFLIECQRGSKAISNAEEVSDSSIQQLAALCISNKYNTAIQLEYQVDKVKRKKKYLRSIVNKTKAQFDGMKKVPVDNNNEAKTERNVMTEDIDITLALNRGDEKLYRRPQKHMNQLNFMIDQISELNARLKDLKFEDEMVDEDELRDKYLAMPANEEEDYGESPSNSPSKAKTVSEDESKQTKEETDTSEEEK